MCTVLLPPGANQIAVNKYIISYHTISYHFFFIILQNFNSQKTCYISISHIMVNRILQIRVIFAVNFETQLGTQCTLLQHELLARENTWEV